MIGHSAAGVSEAGPSVLGPGHARGFGGKMDSETGAVVVSAARATELGPGPDPRQSRHSCSGAWSHTHARMAGARVHAGAGR